MEQHNTVAAKPGTRVGGAPTMQDFLRLVMEKGGTDLHITAEGPPVIRVNGHLVRLPFPPLSVMAW